MLKRRMRWLALIVVALVLAETAAVAQSAAGHIAALGLLDGCRAAAVPNVNVIFVGRPLSARTSDGSRVMPMQVETAFRGNSANIVSVSWFGDSTFDAEQSYLVYGHLAPGGSTIEMQMHMPANADFARRAIQLLTSAVPQRGYVTLMGVVEVGSHPDRPPSLPLSGLRIRLVSDAFATDLFTESNGTFSAAGIPPGRLELKPFLPENLKVFDVKTLTYTAGADECVLLNFFVVSSGRGR
jgi:hypothetical protein